MKKTMLVVAIALLGSFAANASFFTITSFADAGGGNGTLTFVPTCTDYTYYKIRVCDNSGFVIDVFESPISTTCCSTAPITTSVFLSGIAPADAYVDIVSWKTDPGTGLLVSDTTGVGEMCSLPNISGVTTWGTMDSVYFSFTVVGGGGTVPTYAQLFSDAACTWGFPVQTFLVYGNTPTTFAGAVGGLTACTSLWLQLKTCNPVSGQVQTVKEQSTACSELESISASSSGCHIDFNYWCGSMAGNWVDYVITVTRNGSVVQTINHSHSAGLGYPVNISEGIDGCCIGGLYCISATGTDGNGHTLTTSTVCVNVAGDNTGVEQITQQNISCTIQLFSLDSKCVKTYDAVLTKEEIGKISNSKEFPAGIYVLKFTSSTGQYVQKVFVQ